MTTYALIGSMIRKDFDEVLKNDPASEYNPEIKALLLKAKQERIRREYPTGPGTVDGD